MKQPTWMVRPILLLLVLLLIAGCIGISERDLKATFEPTIRTSVVQELEMTQIAATTHRVALRSFHGRYVTAKGEEGDWLLRQEPELSDDCAWFTLRNLGNGKVSLMTCHGRYVIASRAGDARRDWALTQEPAVGECGEFSQVDLGNGETAFVTCAGRLVTAGDGNWDAGDEWLVVAQELCIYGWERFEVLRQ